MIIYITLVQTNLGTDTEPLLILCGQNQMPICFVDRRWSRQDSRRSL